MSSGPTSGRARSFGVLARVTLLFCLLWGAPAQAQYAGGKIFGRVSDPGGRPIRVEIRLLEINQMVVNSTYSDPTSGQFSFTDLRDMAYHVVVDMEPYRRFDTEVSIRPIFQPMVQVNIHLEFRMKNVTTSAPGISGSESHTVRLKDLQAKFPKSVLKTFDRGNRARERGDFEKAIEQYQRALIERPDFDPALTNLGTIYLRQRKFAEAEQVFQQAYRLDSNSAETCVNLGHVYLETGRLAEAEEYLLHATERAPQSALAHFLLGTARAQRGTFEVAEKSLKRALELDEAGMTSAHLALANLYMKTQRWHDAQNSLLAYLRANPQDPQADAIRQALQRIQTQQGQVQ